MRKELKNSKNPYSKDNDTVKRIKNKNFMIKWRKKDKDEYTLQDVRIYYTDRFYKIHKVPHPPFANYLYSHFKALLLHYGVDDVCKAIRWFVRPRNYHQILDETSVPTANAFIGFKDKIFTFALMGKNMDELKPKKKKFIKKVKRHDEEGVWE